MPDEQSTPAQPKSSARPSTSASLGDIYVLATKIERLAKMVQQSVILLMVFGIAVSCMFYGDLVHMYVLSLFTVCSYILLRWGLPRQ